MEAMTAAAIERVKALHHRRPYGPFDFRTHGQTYFGDVCDHCMRPYPCDTIQAIEADDGEDLGSS
ncbi:hypothetical protein [Aeromicrobium sp. 179-A 4D2 NHS]|uniref:hypothetical protein n=1 Tax=Aeromicrobium sp. 179-A 4D2 NHS TaxID=3142375 RepID=UPI00399F5E5D